MNYENIYEQECPICLEEYYNDLTKKTLVCHHDICVFCFYNELLKVCPLCREPINKCNLSIFSIGINSNFIKRNRPAERTFNLIELIKSFFRC